MEIAAALIATVLLVIAALAISREVGDEHPEELDEHDAVRARDEERSRPAQPKAGRQ